MTVLARRGGRTRVVHQPTLNQYLIDTYGVNNLIVLSDFRQIQGAHPTSVVDLSGNAHTGTRAGAVTDVLGHDRNTYPDFSDSSADVNYGDHNDFTISTTEGKTFILLVRPTTATQFQSLFYKMTGASTWEYHIALNTYTTGQFKLQATAYNSAGGGAIIRRETTNASVVNENQWNLVVVAFPPITGTASDFALYVNSNVAQATTDSTSSNAGTGNTAADMHAVSATPPGSALDYEGAIARFIEIRHQLTAPQVGQVINALQREGWTFAA